ALRLQATPADHVLAHVEDVNAWLRLVHRDGFDLAADADGFVRLRDQLRAGLGRDFCRRPGAVVKARAVPSYHLAPRVVDFAVENVRGADRPFAGCPPFVVGFDAGLAA